MKRLRTEDGGYFRRTIGFVSEVVVEPEDHDMFPVTGGSFQRPESAPMRDHDEPTMKKPPR